MAMFYKDTARKMDVVNLLAADDEANLALKVRSEFIKESNTVGMMLPSHSDVFFQDYLMLNGGNLRIKLNRAKDVFCLVSSAAGAYFKVVITEAIFFVRGVKIASSSILGNAGALKHSSAKCPSAESTVPCSLFQEDLAVLTLTTSFWITFLSA